MKSLRCAVLPVLLTCTLLVSTTAVLAQPPAKAPAIPANVDDWAAYGELEKQLEKAEPPAAIEAWKQLYESRPNLLPQVGINISVKIADLYADKLNDNAKALEIEKWALAKYNAEVPAVWLVEHTVKTLNALKRYDETIKITEENWPIILRGGLSTEDWLVMYAATALRYANGAYEAQGQPDKAIEMILKAMRQMPGLWDDKAQGQGGWQNGWMYASLIPKLLKAERSDEALQWAKMHYALCSFDSKCLERATKSLGQVWADKEAYQALRIFNQMQDGTADAAVKNPLTSVKLPSVDEKLMPEHLARTKNPPQGAYKRTLVPEQISVLLYKGDYGAAMNEARRLMKDDPNQNEGSLQICRVFKAADLSTLRANQFLLYLEGKADNPLPQFLKEQEGKNNAPVAEPKNPVP